MKKKILIVFIVFIAFLYGLVVGSTKIFPYSQIKSVKTMIMGENRLSSTTYYLYKRMLESLSFTDYKIVMLGDSITHQGDWHKLSDRRDILNMGISGDNTDGLLWKIDGLPTSINKAFIMIGVNDFGKGENVEYVFANYQRIIEKLRQKNILPIVQSTLYVGKKIKNRNNKDIEKLNNLLLEYTKENNITFIDLNMMLAPNNILSEKYSSSGLHLNGLAYRIWIKKIKKYF